MTDVRPLKRTADEVISPDVASRKKSARDGESFVCTICLESIAPPTDDIDERELIFCEGNRGVAKGGQGGAFAPPSLNDFFKTFVTSLPVLN